VIVVVLTVQRMVTAGKQMTIHKLIHVFLITKILRKTIDRIFCNNLQRLLRNWFSLWSLHIQTVTDDYIVQYCGTFPSLSQYIELCGTPLQGAHAGGLACQSDCACLIRILKTQVSVNHLK